MLKALVVARGSLSTQEFTLSRSVFNRVLQPLCYLRDYTDFPLEFDVLSTSDVSDEQLDKYDVVVLCKHNTEDSINLSRAAQKKNIKVIYDIDDLIHRFTTNSLAYVHMKNVSHLKEHLESSDVIVISTESLQHVLNKDFQMKNQLVIRTGFDIDKYHKKEYSPSQPKVIFTNGDNIKIKSFYEDFTSVFNKFLNKNPEISFDVFGDSDAYLKPFTRYNFLGSLQWEQHKKFLAENQYTFGIVPLGADEEDQEHQLFSKCKTPIKYLEYGALRIPTLYSDAFIYREVVHNNQTGLLVQNNAPSWLDAFERLFSNPSLCKQIADAAFEDIYQNHHIKKMAGKWMNVLKNL